MAQIYRLYPWRVLNRGQGNIRQPIVNLAGTVGMLLTMILLVLAGGFAWIGIEKAEGELQHIGEHLVALNQDISSILPKTRLQAADYYSLQEAFPHVPITFSALDEFTIPNDGGDCKYRVVEAFGDYSITSGTKLVAGTWWTDEKPGMVLGYELAEELFPAGEVVGQTLEIWQ